MGERRVGSYEIERVLARGGMAVVYLARQPALDRWVALKRLDLTSGDPSLAQRFVDEARVVARLDHPNVVTVHDLLEHEGTPYIAMEYVSGGSLRPMIGQLDAVQVIGVLDDVLAGLAHAAEHGVTHRDLKPENVLVTPRGTCKIADFGIAIAHDAVTRLTSTGTALGTPVYMAPEQARGDGVDPRTDLYAVGVMAYELLAGAPPFPGDDAPLSVLYRHVHDPVPPLVPVVPGTPEPLAAWVRGLLAKDRSDRPPDAAAARRALEELAVSSIGPYWRRDAGLAARPDGGGGPPAAEPPTTAAPRAATAETAYLPPARRRRRLAAVGAAGLLAAAGSAALLAGGGDPSEPAPKPRRSAPFALAGGPVAAAGLPGGGARGAGAVVLLASDRERRLAPAARDRDAEFGRAIASADFDGDGRADIAVGAPEARAGARTGRRGAVDVFPSGERAPRLRLAGGDDRRDEMSGRFGAALAAGDLDGDGYGDLVVGAPANDPFPVEDGGSGTIAVHFGAPGGLADGRRRVLRRPRPASAGFGSLLAVADVDGDRRPDVVEAGADHAAFCRGGADGPTACRPMEGAGAAALAAADLTGDGRAEIVHGVPGTAAGGLLRLYRGTARGPARRSERIDQDSPHIPGNGQGGDRFGATLAVADLDGDRHGDVLVGVPGEDRGAGRLVLIRGGDDGYAGTGNRAFEQGSGGMPGRKRAGNGFGTALAFRRGAEGRDLVVAGATGTAWILERVGATLGAARVRTVPLGLRGRGDVTLAG